MVSQAKCFFMCFPHLWKFTLGFFMFLFMVFHVFLNGFCTYVPMTCPLKPPSPRLAEGLRSRARRARRHDDLKGSAIPVARLDIPSVKL